MPHPISAILLLLLFSLKFTIVWYVSFLTFYYSTKLVHTPNHCYTQIQAAILKHFSPGSVFHSSVRLGFVHANACAISI